ncbi:E3 SUMO-protein ligase nse2 [Hypsizygus marmoreus]|uniref:E3 SUMO-protein ligase nse2 n=1 Tax=Hypsizygus marmoreus TaxID=39966 RepID=A0A369J7K9_HYPMA|nr:E3 SUMO-protein ligase nse2 [Hypsizygus marmoreus]
MPVSTFSRRKSSRRQMSSDIEEDRPSQSRADEQVEEADEGPSRRRTNGVKKEKKPNISRRQERAPEVNGNRDEDDEDDDDDDEDGRIDIANFRDQPLAKTDVVKLQGIARDWNQMEITTRQNWRVVGDVAVAIADAAEGEDAEQGLAELDIIMKDLIDIGVEMQAHEKALDDIAQKVGQGEDVDDAIERYGDGVQTRMEEYTKKTTRQKYAKSEEYTSFKHNIYEIQHPEKALPPITDFIPKEDGDASDDEDDLEMGGVSQVYTCPITLVALEKPVTSSVCGHSFSSNAILQSFQGSPTVKCPTSGCTKRFSRSDLKPNKELEKKVKAWQRRAQRAAENSDAEEIID